MNPSNPCEALSHSLLSLTALEKEINILYERLIKEDTSSLSDIEQALYGKKKELAIVEQDIKRSIEALEKTKTSKEKSPDEIDSLLKGLGSPASLDRSFEGGIVSLKITPELKTQLQSYTTAKVALEKASTTGVTVSSDIEKISKLPNVWTTITKDTLDILVLNYPVGRVTEDVTSEAERDILTEKMDKLGYRPLELSEFMALGITHPQYQEVRAEYLNSMKKYTLGAGILVPYLYRGGYGRRLDALWSVGEWNDGSRFLFLRK